MGIGVQFINGKAGLPKSSLLLSAPAAAMTFLRLANDSRDPEWVVPRMDGGYSTQRIPYGQLGAGRSTLRLVVSVPAGLQLGDLQHRGRISSLWDRVQRSTHRAVRLQ
jgi:hypothetical protein